MKKLLLAVATLALASGSALAQAPVPVSLHRLTAAEIRAAYVGNTAYGLGRFGPKSFESYFAPDGQVRMRSPNITENGTYRITDDDMYCSKYQTIRGGVDTCQMVYQTGPNAYEVHPAIGPIVKVTIVPGNPDGL